jgi:hypothetical protein
VKRVKQTGEVFTPRSLIREMLDALPNSVWFDPNKRWLEPSAGDGNFLVEIKVRLLQAGHDEKHILENMLFSVELIDDNHWVLQHRLGYLIDGQPNPKFWPNGEHFDIGQIHQIAQDLNDHNPYHEQLGLDQDQVLFHRNHVCTTALEYDMSFGRTDDEFIEVLEVLDERDLGAWPETDTPDIGEKYMVEKMLGRQPQLAQQEIPVPPVQPEIDTSKLFKQPKPAKPVKAAKEPKPESEPTGPGGGWQIKAEWYGKGMTIRCKDPLDGSFWECDHDALADVVNASLKAKGKTILGEPGPSLKQYGSGHGLREPNLWRRV